MPALYWLQICLWYQVNVIPWELLGVYTFGQRKMSISYQKMFWAIFESSWWQFNCKNSPNIGDYWAIFKNSPNIGDFWAIFKNSPNICDFWAIFKNITFLKKNCRGHVSNNFWFIWPGFFNSNIWNPNWYCRNTNGRKIVQYLRHKWVGSRKFPLSSWLS